MLRQESKRRVVRGSWIQNEEKNQWGPLAVRRENRSDFWYVLFISSLQASGEFPAGGHCIHLTESCRAAPYYIENCLK